MHRVALACGLLTLTCLCAVAADRPDPAAFRKDVMANPHLHNSSGEGFCWHFAARADDFIQGYEAYRDPAWLAVAAEHYDWAIKRVVIDDPDGFPGTFGGPFDNNQPGAAAIVHDTIVGDGLLAEPLTAWAEIVLADPALKERFGATAQRYVDLAQRMCFDKLEHRGSYYRDRLGYGSYHTLGKGIEVATGTWVPYGSVISDNLNKHYTNGRVLLRLWRISGDAALKQRVVEIFSRHKAMRRHFPDEDRVVWNFWMPHGPYDIKGNAPESWVAVHPNRAGYQAGETADFVEVYDSGLVFDRRDLELMIATNVWMSERGWKSADGKTDAGTLWGALARFDPTLGAIAAERRAQAKGDIGAIRRAISAPATADPWQRRHVPAHHQVEVSEVALQPGVHLGMAMVIPDTVHYLADRRVRLATQVNGAGQLTIDLLSADGTQVLGTIAEQAITDTDNYFSPLWDGRNPASGEHQAGAYLVRWTFKGEQRTWPVWVEAGEAPAPGESAEIIAAGERISIDFEGELDPRWKLGNKAELSAEQVHAGGQALAVRGGSAEFAFGRHDDLPVKISAWIHDGGAKRGKKNGNGPGIGIRTANGDLFVVRQAWRGYLGGDGAYAWFNTGENKWFTPHPTNLKRSTGWHHWVFDFSGEQTVVTCDGNAIDSDKLQPEKFVPTGATTLVLFGGLGDDPAGVLYVDDIEVSRP